MNKNWVTFFWFVFTLVLGSFTMSLQVHADPNPTGNVGVYSQSTVQMTSTSTNFLLRNPNRKYLLVQNQGASTVYMKFGSTVSTATDGVSLTSGSSFNPSPALVDAIWGLTSAGSVSLRVIEGIK